MHVALLGGTIPNKSSGGPLTLWSILRELVARGHRVSLISILRPDDVHLAENKAERIRAVTGPNVQYFELTATQPPPPRSHSKLTTLRQMLELEFHYPNTELASAIDSIMHRIEPDIILAYEVSILASTAQITSIPRVGALGDLDHLPALYRLLNQRFKFEGPYLKLAAATLMRGYILPKFMTKLLSECQSVICFAAHHAKWLQSHGIENCRYFPTPIPDSAGTSWEARRLNAEIPEKPKVLMMGHLRGTATRAGLDLFARRILPALERELGPRGFEIHILGAYADSLPQALAEQLSRPSVRFRGHIEPPDEELQSAHILLVPTPIELGIRVRILVGFSFGCCIVAHKSNALGIPELAHRGNILLAGDGKELATAVIQAIREPPLRKILGSNARTTFERVFEQSVAGGRVIEELERICAR